MGEEEFVACLKLEHVKEHDSFPPCPPLHLLVGYSFATGRYWCRIFIPGGYRFPEIVASVATWCAAFAYLRPADKCGTEATFSTGVPGVRSIHITMSPGLCQDQVSSIVDIDGLLHESQDLENFRHLALE
jgi:hypothetical protein